MMYPKLSDPFAPTAPIGGAAGTRVATVDLPTGVTLSYHEQGARSGEVVVLLHGYTDSVYSYSRLMPLLSGEHRVFALDQRGHGNSSKPATGYAMSDFVADVVAFLDSQEIERATIVGHSMGSLIAQQVAVHDPARVASLVLIGAFAAGSNPGVDELNQAVQTLIDPIDPAFVEEFQRSTIYGAVPPLFLEQVIAESLKVPARVWRQALADFVRQDLRPDLPRLAAPTLILWGDQDTICPRSDQETLHRLIPNSTWLTYVETGHAVHWEQPAAVAADLERFLLATAH